MTPDLCLCDAVTISDCNQCSIPICAACEEIGLCHECLADHDDFENTEDEDTAPAALIGEPASDPDDT